MYSNKHRNKKPIIAVDLSTKGKGGGPFTSTSRIMSSELKNEFQFEVINYDVGLGRGVSWSRIKDLQKQIEEINPDIVHYTGLQLSGFHVAIACLLAGAKNTILTIRGMSGDSIFFNQFKKVLLKFIVEPFTLILVTKFYCVSDYVSSRGIAKLFYWKSEGTIYNFPPHNLEQYDKSLLRKKYGFSENDLVVVSIARINKEKGYHILEDAIKQLKEYKNIKFLIAGSGDYLDTMKKNLSNQIDIGKIVFLGFTSEVQKVNNCGDVFMLPTLHETLSIALLEASYAKLSLIASNVGGVPEIVENNINGILVEPNNSKQIFEAILKLHNDRDLCKTFSENAYRKVFEKFSADEISKKISKVYNSLLE